MLNLPSSHVIWNGREMGQAHFPSSLHLRAAEIENGDGSSFRTREMHRSVRLFLSEQGLSTFMQRGVRSGGADRDLREFNHLPQCWRLHRPWNRRILAESQASAGFLIILKIRLQDATQALFVEDSLRGPNTRGGSNR